jgi:hypothetical protein
VPRYPLESVSKLELKEDESVGWEEQVNAVESVGEASGLVYWGYDMAAASAQIRLTYTGGFWWETAEPEDAAYPTAMPTGATALPEALRTAWLLQCESVWRAHDRLGQATVDAPEAPPALALSDLVREMLRPFIRYQIG